MPNSWRQRLHDRSMCGARSPMPRRSVTARTTCVAWDPASMESDTCILPDPRAGACRNPSVCPSRAGCKWRRPEPAEHAVTLRAPLESDSSMNGRRTVFFISDSTGITAETIGNSILAQFEGVQFDGHRIAFVDTPDKARAAALRIKTVYAQHDQRPIVVNTVVDPQLCEIIGESAGLVTDVPAPFP